MNWNDAKPTLTTLESIARFEKEVNRLAGDTEVWALRSLPDKTYKLNFSGAVDSVYFLFASGGEATYLTEKDDINIPTVPVVKVVAYDANGGVMGSFDLRNARQTVISCCDSGLSMTLSDADAWITASISQTWEDKLNLAIEAVENDILTILLPKLNTATDEEALAQITNAETFRKACDLKALELIFRDLGLGTFNQMHELKAQNYAGAYKEEITAAFLRMRTGADGTDGERIITVGKIVR